MRRPSNAFAVFRFGQSGAVHTRLPIIERGAALLAWVEAQTVAMGDPMASRAGEGVLVGIRVGRLQQRVEVRRAGVSDDPLWKLVQPFGVHFASVLRFLVSSAGRSFPHHSF